MHIINLLNPSYIFFLLFLPIYDFILNVAFSLYFELISLCTNNISFFLYHVLKTGYQHFFYFLAWFLHNLGTALALNAPERNYFAMFFWFIQLEIENLWGIDRDLKHSQELCYVSLNFKNSYRLKSGNSLQSICVNMLLFNPQFIVFFLKRIL